MYMFRKYSFCVCMVPCNGMRKREGEFVSIPLTPGTNSEARSVYKATHFLFVSKISCLLTKQDGWTDCKHLDRTTCPPLNCTDGEFTLEDACCPICLGTDLCEHLGHPCHADASCKTIKSPDSQTFTCRCKEGFLGDGKQCSDYNECTTTDASKRHKCSANSQCINLPGTYRCDCLPGYVMSDDGYTCQGKRF